MAKVSIRKEELDRLIETAQRTAKRTNSVVVVAEERVDIDERPLPEAPVGKPAVYFN